MIKRKENLREMLWELALDLEYQPKLSSLLNQNLQLFQAKLGVSGCLVHHTKKGPGLSYNFEPIYKFLENSAIENLSQSVLKNIPQNLEKKQKDRFLANLPIIGEQNSYWYYITELPKFGLISLIRKGKGLNAETLQMLTPILNRFAGMCRSAKETELNQQQFSIFEKIFHSSIDTFIIFDLRGNILKANQDARRLFGYSEDEFLQLSYHDLVPNDIMNQFELFKLVIQKTNVFRTESKFLSKNRMIFTSEIRGTIFQDQQQSYLLASLRDISEFKISEEILQNEKERLSVTLRSINEGVITTDINDRIVFLNHTAEKLTECSQEEVFGESVFSIFKLEEENTGKSIENPIQTVLQEDGSITPGINAILVSKSGKRITVSARATPIKDIDELMIGLVLVFMDITEKKKLETELIKIKKLDSIGILAGGIAHDFNNLLTGILGNINFSLHHISAESIAFNRLKEAEKASLRAKALTNQLLTFSKGGKPVKKSVPIEEVIKDSMGFMTMSSNVEFELRTEPNLPKVKVDAAQIAQVFQNIAINAVQAMPNSGKILVDIRKAPLDKILKIPIKMERYLMISVQDQGTGISKSIMDKIFDPFFTTKPEGTGLGLSIAYSIIKMHEGYIDIESKPGKGTTFIIYLPITDDRPHILSEELTTTTTLPEKLKNKKILFMDDEEIVRDVAMAMLTELGCEVKFAQDGHQAIEMYINEKKSGKPFDLVIMDLTIPGKMGGKDTIKKLSEMDQDVRAIVTSGYSNDPVMSDFEKFGFKGILQKPFKFQEMEEVLGRFAE